MTDQYQSFANSPLGKIVVKNLGLPTPIQLARFQAGDAVIDGAVLFGAAQTSELSATISQILLNVHADSYVLSPELIQDNPQQPSDQACSDQASSDQIQVNQHNESDVVSQAATIGLHLRQAAAHQKFKAVLFDASAIKTVEQLKSVYEFFHPVARQLTSSGRVIVIGRTPDTTDTLEAAIAQRSLEGFVKSVGKEFKKGITAQLVYVDSGAEQQLESTLRFLLSTRSAYVSGQVITVHLADVVSTDWSKPLAGKVAVVTGASRGIGEAIAHTLARDGAHVICLDVVQQQSDLERVAKAIGGSVLTLDITAVDAGEQIEQAARTRGGLDIIVHNAGITRDKTLANMTEAMWDLVLRINLAAIVKVNDYLIEHQFIRHHGRIVCVSSIGGIAGNLGQTNYATSKAGVIGVVKFTAPRLTKGITISAVAPGFIETQMTAAIPFTIREAGRRMNSMNQGGLPIDVAETIAYLASNGSNGLNGNVIRVCGQSLLGA